ncbi:Met-10+ like-protein-domain-containing protein [Mrakia frigida]|uniref:tRNA (guanine) methyltransferase n=1 Tax=Mrakia frigida TaxID=29902 RepID=UPI003FCC11B1
MSSPASSARSSLLQRASLPPANPGMSFPLDKSKFEVGFTTLAARVPASRSREVRDNKIIQGSFLSIPRFSSYVVDPQNPKEKRLILLDTPEKDELTSEVLSELELAAGHPLDLLPYSFTLGFDHWTTSDLMDSILPLELRDGAPTAFTFAGHLAHMNLKDNYLPYKYQIGEIVLHKNTTLRTVVNKLDTIDNEFRFFKMEVIAGETDFLVNTIESGCKFTFDFSTVYWNSRLSTEHDRLISLFQPGQLVADVFAGVGPFAVPAAKKRCLVLGNDLNPSSAEWMQKNRVANKVEKSLTVSNIDGRLFIHQTPLQSYLHPFPALAPPAPKRVRTSKTSTANATNSSTPSSPPKAPAPALAPTPSPLFVSHYVMNLPGSALEFLDAFRGSYTPLLSVQKEGGAEGERLTVEEVEMPLVHVHCFSKFEGEEAESDVAERASESLGFPISRASTPDFSLKEVRRVAPKKLMFCVTFRLPREVAFATERVWSPLDPVKESHGH